MQTLTSEADLDRLDASDVEAVEARLRIFLAADPDSPAALEQWVLELSRLYEVIDEKGSRLYIENACDTENAGKEKAYLHWITEVRPRLKPLLFEIQKKLVQHPLRAAVGEPSFAVMLREWEADVAIYRDQNVPLQTRCDELEKDYGKIMGAMLVEFRGEQLTLQQLARYLEEPDRSTRAEAWELSARRRLQDRDRLDGLFDELLVLRRTIAANAGMKDYREYIWTARKRFDYSPGDCLAFGDAAADTCVPLLRLVQEERRQALGLQTLKPWDMAVDVKNRPPLRPFDGRNVDELVRGVETIFERLSPSLARKFHSLVENGDLDLASRKGKRPGGFQSSLERCKRPFIFMNAAGLQHDVSTLLHEGGHAFHYLAARQQPNLFVRHAPLEFCEVASMSMELLACDHFDVFYANPEDAARAKRAQLEDVVRLLPWIATIDGFQHWLYTHPGHTPPERTQAWMDLLDRFSGGMVDWSGWEEIQQSMWHRQIHLFEAPFYYIEYGIAQLGALGVWLNYRRNPEEALHRLLEAFALGGTRPLPELFHAAGVTFDFSSAGVETAIAAVQDDLSRLPI